MNWHAKLLRNEISKLKQGFQTRLDLLTTTSPTSQSYLDLEAERDNLTEQLKDISEIQQKLTVAEAHKTALELFLQDEKQTSEELTKKTQQQKEQITKLATTLLQNEKELLTQETNFNQALQINEQRWIKKNQDQTTKIKELTNQIIQLEKEQAKQKEITSKEKSKEQSSKIKKEQEKLNEIKPTPLETKWRNIHRDFTEELIDEWTTKNFTYEQTQEWINIGLTVNDAVFATWLRDIKQKTAEWVLNNGDIKELKKECLNNLIKRK